ncbi:hypothetical protein [Streptomyces sp. NPDC013187]
MPHHPTDDAEGAKPISNQQVSTHPFLRALHVDGYCPDDVVDRGD